MKRIVFLVLVLVLCVGGATAAVMVAKSRKDASLEAQKVEMPTNTTKPPETTAAPEDLSSENRKTTTPILITTDGSLPAAVPAGNRFLPVIISARGFHCLMPVLNPFPQYNGRLPAGSRSSVSIKKI